MSSSAGSALIEQTLLELGFEKIKRQSKGFMACCRFHNDRNPSFSINDQGLWQCFSCGVKGNFKQLHEKLGSSVGDWRTTCKVLGIELQDRTVVRRMSTKRVRLPDGFSTYSMPEEVPPFIARRVTWETIQKFKLGSAPGWAFRDRCVIPIFYKGKDVGYHARDVSGRSERKYLNPKDYSIKDYLFNYDGCTEGRELFIAEGAFSCMSMVEKGFTNTVATFGTKYTPIQIKRVFELDPKSVVICFDRDPSKIVNGREDGRAGQKAALRLAKTLGDMINVSIMPLPPKKDPNDIPKEMLEKCYANRRAYEDLVGKATHGS